jgi:hypothetical protein
MPERVREVIVETSTAESLHESQYVKVPEKETQVPAVYAQILHVFSNNTLTLLTGNK